MNAIALADALANFLANVLAGLTADGSIAMLSLMLGMVCAWRWSARAEERTPRRARPLDRHDRGR